MDAILHVLHQLNSHEQELRDRRDVKTVIVNRKRKRQVPNEIPRQFQMLRKKMWHAEIERNRRKNVYTKVEIQPIEVDPYFYTAPETKVDEIEDVNHLLFFNCSQTAVQEQEAKSPKRNRRDPIRRHPKPKQRANYKEVRGTYQDDDSI